MLTRSIRRVFSAATAVFMLASVAVAQSPSDDVSGYNPFDGTTTTVAPQPTTAYSGSNVAEMFGANNAPTGGAFDNASGSSDIFSSQASTGTFTNDVNDSFNLGGTQQAATAADPFALGGTQQTTAAADPFGASSQQSAAADPFALGGTQQATAADPFGASSQQSTAADPFALGGTQQATAADPFGTGAQPAATLAPIPTVKGYNPFTDAQNDAIQAVPANTMMYVVASTVKLRAKPIENARQVGAFYFGQELSVTATQGDWAQVQNPNNHRTGYCLLNELSYIDPNTMSKLMYAQLATTPVYRAPSTKTGRMRNLRQGDTTTVVAITSDGLWSRVTDGTQYGFVPTIYLDESPSTEGTQVWCASGATAVMVNPDNWTRISTLSFGQQAWLVGYTNNNTIAKIRSAKNYVAYCDASALTTVDPASLNTPVYVQAGGKVLFVNASEDAKHFNVNKNAYLTLLGVDSSQYWALVKQGKRKLYIPFIYLGPERAGQDYKAVVVNQDAPLYNAANGDSGALTTLPLGTRLYLLGGDGIYAQVTTIPDGATPVSGYLPMQYLRSE